MLSMQTTQTELHAEMGERRAHPTLFTTDSARSGIVSLERHCSVGELSKLWGFSENTIRRLFKKEPGVLKIVHEGTMQKRRYTSLRIPERIAQRVHRRLQGLA